MRYSFLSYTNLILTLTDTFLTLTDKQSVKNVVGPRNVEGVSRGPSTGNHVMLRDASLSDSCTFDH